MENFSTDISSHRPKSKPSAAPAPYKPDSKRLAGVKVLLVEDMPDNQVLTTLMLKSAGANVTIVGSGKLAVSAAMQADYDVILMDIQMPDVDGYEATMRLREMGYKKPILALTAFSVRGTRERCFDVGCNDQLTKPISRTTLVEKVYQFTKGDLMN